MKKIICFFAIIQIAVSMFSQEFLYVAIQSERDNVHYIIDDRVNVRSAPNLSGEKLFQLNAGDEVTITEFNQNWDRLFAEGYYAPWYKISCKKGEGYICGRYVSCKETIGDLDNDGKNEIDFYARKGNRHYYIQVTDNIGDAKTKAREYRVSFFLIGET